MLATVSRSGVPVRHLLLVAGRMGRTYIMPAVKNSKINGLIIEHHEGRLPQVLEYTMTNEEGRSVTFTLLIVKKKKSGDEKKDGVGDMTLKYVVFATNRRIRSVRATIKSIPEEYRTRWEIERGFRVIKGAMGWTCSNSSTVRLMLFHIPLIMYNLWRIARFVDMTFEWAGGQARNCSP